jgi:hypothetical protein
MESFCSARDLTIPAPASISVFFWVGTMHNSNPLGNIFDSDLSGI